MTHDETLRQLKLEYEEKRRNHLRETDLRREEACSRIPELECLLNSRSSLVMDGIRQMLQNMNQPGDHRGIDLQPQMDQLSEEIAFKLQAAGFPADYLQPKYDCDICKDQGFLYHPSSTMCDCMKKELIRRDMERFGIAPDGPSFDRFQLKYYEASDEQVTPRKLAETAKRNCEAFAENYPANQIPNLLITGTSGLGKTFLLQCIARRLMEKLVSVEYISAYRLIEIARDAWFGEEETNMDVLLQAPILMIDDLGTEPLINNITITQLFHLLNERDQNGLSTVITSNLKMSELQDRYTERITSRLQDRNKWKHLVLQGKDIRQIRR